MIFKIIKHLFLVVLFLEFCKIYEFRNEIIKRKCAISIDSIKNFTTKFASLKINCKNLKLLSSSES